jgi:tetratricopeptide (TPR) repeat protein
MRPRIPKIMLTLVPDYRAPAGEAGHHLPDTSPEPRALEIGPAPPALATGDLSARYDELRDQGKAELEAGHLEEALRLFDDAYVVAERLGEQERLDLALCNRTAVSLMMGPSEGACRTLREVLVRNGSPVTSWLAAYNLSWAYEYKKEGKKGLFYGRVSLNYAQASGDAERIAQARNQVGNCLLAESHFEDATGEYLRALKLLPEELSLVRVGILNNLAYARVVLGEHKEACSLLFTCLRWHRRRGTRLYEAWPHLDLCYAYLEIGRVRLAWKHGFKALSLAEETGDYNLIRLALYLMGSVEKEGGDMESAYHYFERLQREFYPDVVNLPEMMLVVDARKIVNLRA